MNMNELMKAGFDDEETGKQTEQTEVKKPELANAKQIKTVEHKPTVKLAEAAVVKPTVVKAIEVGEVPKIKFEDASPLVKKSFITLNKFRDEVNGYFIFADKLDRVDAAIVEALHVKFPEHEKVKSLTAEITTCKTIIRKIEKTFKEANEFVNEQNGTGASDWLEDLIPMIKGVRKNVAKVQGILQTNEINLDVLVKKVVETPKLVAKRKEEKRIETLMIKSFTQVETLRQLVEDARREEKLIYKNNMFKKAKDQRDELLSLINNDKEIIFGSQVIGKDLFAKIKTLVEVKDIDKAFEELNVLGEQVMVARQTWEELFNILAVLSRVSVSTPVTAEVTEKIVEEIKKVVSESANAQPQLQEAIANAKAVAQTVAAEAPAVKKTVAEEPKTESVVEATPVAEKVAAEAPVKKHKTHKASKALKAEKEPETVFNLDGASPLIVKAFASLEKIKHEVEKYADLAAKIDESSEVVLKTLQSKNLNEDKFNELFQEITNFQEIMGRTEQTIKQAEGLIVDRNELGISEVLVSLNPLVKETRKCFNAVTNIFKHHNVRLLAPKQSSKEKAKEAAKRKRVQEIDILQIKAFTKVETLRQLVEDANREEKLIYKHNRFRRAKDKRADLLTSIVINKDLIKNSLVKGQEIYERIEFLLSTEDLPEAHLQYKELDNQVRISRKSWEALFNVLAILNDVSNSSEVTEEIVAQAIAKIKAEKTVETQLNNRNLQVRLDVIEAKIKNMETSYLSKIDELEAEALIATKKIEGISQIDAKREITHAVADLKYAFEQSNIVLQQTRNIMLEENVVKLERDVDRNLSRAVELFMKIIVKYLPNIADQKRAGKYHTVAQVNAKLEAYKKQIEKADKQMLKYDTLLTYMNDKMQIAEANASSHLSDEGIVALKTDLAHEWEVLMDEVTIVKRHLVLAKQCLEDRNLNGTSNHVKRFNELHPIIPFEARHFEYHLSVLMGVKLEKYNVEKMSAARNAKIVARIEKMLPRYEKLFNRYEVQLIHSKSNYEIAMVFANKYHEEAELRDRSLQIQRLLSHLNKMLESARNMIKTETEAIRNLSGESAVKTLNGLKVNEDAYIGKHKVDHLEEKISRLTAKERGHAPKWITVVSIISLVVAITVTVLVVGGVVGFIKFPKF